MHVYYAHTSKAHVSIHDMYYNEGRMESNLLWGHAMIFWGILTHSPYHFLFMYSFNYVCT